jgi:tetratricopeptide (TPR) repeat protein
MCLDWLDRPQEASKYYVKGLELRPNNAIVYFYMGRHCMDLGNYPLAEYWLIMSELVHPPSDQAEAYLKVVRERLAAARAGRLP